MPASLAVELCGLPGAGKTTVARGANDRLGAAKVSCEIADRDISAAATSRQRVRRRAASALRESVRHPGHTAAAVNAVLASGQSRPRDAVAIVAQWLTVRDLVAASHRAPGVHLFEEGVLQRLWTLGLRGDHDVSQRLWHSLEPARRTDLVVVLDLPPTEAVARLRSRRSRHSRVQQLAPEAMLEELERGRRLLDHLVAGSPVPVVRISAEPAPELVAERVAGVLLDALIDAPIGQ